MPSRSSHSTEAIVEAKRRWVARPWASRRVVRPGCVAQGLRDLGRRGDPDRAVERAREVGGEDLGDLDRRLGPADLGELHPGQLAGARSPTARSASARLATLSSAAIGIEVDCASSASLLERGDRLLGQLDVERLQLGQRPLRGLAASQAPLASTRIRASGPTASRTPAPADVVAGARASA